MKCPSCGSEMEWSSHADVVEDLFDGESYPHEFRNINKHYCRSCTKSFWILETV